MSKKIQLIRPPIDEWYKTGQITELVSYPTWLCLIAAGLKDRGIKAEVIDGLKLSLAELKSMIDADFVGVTDIYSFHQNSLALLKEAKEKGAETVIGGPNVNYLAERILANHSFVDYAVVGDGEEALPLLASGAGLETIPNLVYRRGNQITRNQRKDAPLTNLFDLEDIVNLAPIDTSKAVSISSIRGCIKAEKKGRCSFCSIDHKLKLMEPSLVWSQIGLLHEKYGFNYFLEAGDSFMVGNYPEKLLLSRPKHLSGTSFRIFTSPDQLSRKELEILMALNVKNIFLGIESANDEILKGAQKSYRLRDIENAIVLLKECKSKGYNFTVHFPFMYGLPGETEKTAEDSFRFAEKVISQFYPVIVISSFPVPLAGTALFENLRRDERTQKEYHGNLDKDDFFDYQALVRLQLKYFTSIDYDFALGMIDKTRNLVQDKNNVTSFDINR